MKSTRYQKGVITPYNINIAQLRNPNVVMWWSAAMPGFGHLMLCKYMIGFILIVWEYTVNVNSNLNLAIYYTFTGHFDMAGEVLDQNWILLYVPVYLFSIWDSRRVAMDLNKYAILADSNLTISEMKSISFSALENNYLDKRKPWLSVFWSILMPGLGHFYINRTPSALYILLWWVVTLYFSNALQGIHYTFIGEFQEAINLMDQQWIMFIPSLYGFAAYDAYLNCESYNQVLKSQQSYLLINQYQQCKKNVSFFTKRADEVNIVASFAHTIYLELALDELNKNGLDKNKVFAVPLTEKYKPEKNIEKIRGNGVKLFDATFALGTIFSLFGVIYGFVLKGGPVIWGLVGLGIGWGIGYMIDVLQSKQQKAKGGEVVLIIHCGRDEVNMVKQILFDHSILGLHVVDDSHLLK